MSATPSPADRPSRRWGVALAVAVAWAVSRGFVVGLLFGYFSWVQGDLSYFDASLSHLGSLGIAHTLVEYPLPGVAVIGLPWEVARLLGHPSWFNEAFIAMMVALDAAFLVLLRRAEGPGRIAGTVLWLLAVPVFGPTTFARFDLVPGVLLGVAVLLLATRPRVAAAAAALGTGVKFWPALSLVPIASRAGDRWSVVRVVAGVGSTLAVLSVLLGGWARLLSPVVWQSDRGLQIESVAASVPMLGWATHSGHSGGSGRPGPYDIQFTSHNAFEITGPGVGTALAVGSLATVALVLGLLALWWRGWRAGDRLEPTTVAWMCLAAVAGFMVTSKVFSPQYLLWLLPAASAALVTASRSGASRDRRLLRWAVLLLVAAGLTQAVFPILYVPLIGHHPHSVPAVLVLVVRNAVMLALTALAWREAWRGVGRG